MEPKKELTKDQNSRINKIYMNSFFRTMWSGCRAGLLLGVANIIIAYVAVWFEIDPTTPGADAFVWASAGTTIFFIFRSLGQKIRADHDKVSEEIKKILAE